jgi:hypothetical protein
MNEAQLKWIDALENGNFIQSFFGWLHTMSYRNKILYCPLGVACVVLDNNPKPKGTDLSIHPCEKKLFLPVEGQLRIQVLNDQERMPFQFIAETIRHNPHNFFTNC